MAFTEVQVYNVTANTTPVILVPAPLLGRYIIKNITAFNPNSGNATVDFILDDGGNQTLLNRQIAVPNETISYTDVIVLDSDNKTLQVALTANQTSQAQCSAHYAIAAPGENTYQLANTLVALSTFDSNGLMTQTNTDTFTARTLVVGSGMSISNANGVGGNPSIGLDPTLIALSTFVDNGIMTKTGTDIFEARTLTTTANQGIFITNGDGVSGNPTVNMNITGMTADTTPDITTDYVATYDNSGTTNKKVLLKDLNNLIKARIISNATQSIANNTATTVIFNTTDYNTNSLVTNNTTMTIPFTGYYLLNTRVAFEADVQTSGFYRLEMFVNGSTTRSTSTKATSSNSQQLFLWLNLVQNLNANDTVTIVVTQTTGSSHNIGTSASLFQLTWMGI